LAAVEDAEALGALGDMQRARGDLAAALSSYRAAYAIADRLTRADAADQSRKHELSVVFDRIAAAQSELGDLTAALASYRASLALAEDLTKAFPAEALWQRDLMVSHNKIGDVQF
jgi:tetratricopeptide (TPR) repeat protein